MSGGDEMDKLFKGAQETAEVFLKWLIIGTSAAIIVAVLAVGLTVGR